MVWVWQILQSVQSVQCPVSSVQCPSHHAVTHHEEHEEDVLRSIEIEVGLQHRAPNVGGLAHLNGNEALQRNLDDRLLGPDLLRR